jgi:hypothetical protein
MFAQGYGCDQSMWQDRPFRRTSRQFHDRSAAAIKEPERFETLTMVGPSPHYINETVISGDSTAATSTGFSSLSRAIMLLGPRDGVRDHGPRRKARVSGRA